MCIINWSWILAQVNLENGKQILTNCWNTNKEYTTQWTMIVVLNKEQFTILTETLKNSHLDSTLGRRSIYRKLTYTKLYLNQSNHLQAVIITVLERVKSIADAADYLQEEVDYLKWVFCKMANLKGRWNGRLPRKCKNNRNPTEGWRSDQRGSCGPILQHPLQPISMPPPQMEPHNSVLLPSPQAKAAEDPLLQRVLGVYKIMCSCGLCYIGQTGRSVSIRCIKHQQHCGWGT